MKPTEKYKRYYLHQYQNMFSIKLSYTQSIFILFNKLVNEIYLQRTCLAACEDQQNIVAMTTSRLPNRQTMLEWPDFCVILRKIEKSCLQKWKRPDLDKAYPSLCSSLLMKVNYFKWLSN